MKTYIHRQCAKEQPHLQQFQRDNEERFKAIFTAAGLRKSQLVFPVFVSDKPVKISSMPGMFVTSVAKLAQYVQSATDRGISSLIVFGIPKSRDQKGSSASDKKGVVQRAVKEIKSGFGSSVNVIT
ncbi:MAG TPA: hypothetical protein VI338_07535, partial [Nitrososphaera sp.]|nr:hypothetical protein [Nitrososphaera sp.]